MKNNEAERLACRLGQLGAILTVHHREYNPAPILENSTRAMTEAAALIRAQAARISELEANLREMTRRRDLVKAGALILAEIERLDRAAPQPKQEDM